LAAANYNEMASSVLDPLYLIRLSLDTVLSSFFRFISPPASSRKERETDDGRGGVWESLYRMTTFRWGLAYEEVLARREWQKRILERTMAAVVGGTVTLLGTIAWIRLRGPAGRGIVSDRLHQFLPGWFH
jgi:kynurenine 3-monooxygenase